MSPGKRGRPPEIPGGEDERITIRVGRLHVRELEQLASEQGLSTAAAIRWLIEQSAKRRAARG